MGYCDMLRGNKMYLNVTAYPYLSLCVVAFCYVMLNACRSIHTSALILHCCSRFVLQFELFCSYKMVGFISVPLLSLRFCRRTAERGRLGEGWISKTESRAFAWSYGTVICVFNVPVTSVVQQRYIYFSVCTFYRHWRFRYYWNKMNLPFISYRH